MPQNIYLRVEGTLTCGGWLYTAKPGQEARRVPAEFLAELADQEETDLEAVLLVGNDAVVARAKPRLRRSLCGGNQAKRPVQFAAYLPLLADAVSYEIRNGGVTLYRASIPQASPKLELAPLKHEGDEIEIQWRSHGHGTDAPAHFRVACLVGDRTFPLAVVRNQHRIRVDLSRIPGPGEAYISVLVSDRVRSSVVLSDPFPIPAREPVLALLSPAENSSFGFLEPITLSCSASDVGGRTLPDDLIEWRCDEQVVARGTRAALLTDLPPGQHRITLSVSNSERSVTIAVREQSPEELEWALAFADADSENAPWNSRPQASRRAFARRSQD